LGLGDPLGLEDPLVLGDPWALGTLGLGDPWGPGPWARILYIRVNTSMCIVYIYNTSIYPTYFNLRKQIILLSNFGAFRSLSEISIVHKVWGREPARLQARRFMVGSSLSFGGKHKRERLETSLQKYRKTDSPTPEVNLTWLGSSHLSATNYAQEFNIKT